MKQMLSHKYCRAFLQIAGIVLLTTLIFSQSTMGQTKFKKYSGNPVLTVGPAGSWDALYVNSSSVLYHNSKYHMWYIGSNTEDNSTQSFGYAFSDDGISWTKYSGNPVLRPGPAGAFDELLGLCAVSFYGDKFHMWYTGRGTPRAIGYAYSSDGITWTKNPTPVFFGGGVGSWDEFIAVGPVVKDTVFKMFYWGRSATSSFMTGLATSPDSIHWTRQNSGNPVLGGATIGAWDQYSQAAYDVIKTGGIYEMWYDNEKQSPYCIGYATSTNGGLNWTTYAGNPILWGDAGTWDAGAIGNPQVMRRSDGRYLLYYAGINIAGTRASIGLAIDSAIMSGTYTVGKTGYFPSLDSAFARLSRDGVLGPVTLSLIDTLYDATTNASGSYKLVGPISGAGPASRITIRPADNVAVTIKGNGDAALWFNNVSYLTLDGVNLQGNTRLKVRALYNASFKYNDGVDFWGNSDHNIIQNLTASSDDITRTSCVVAFYGYDNLSGSSDSCLISGLSITSGYIGIYLYGPAGMRLNGNIIRNNHIGSPSDSLIAIGIYNDLSSEGTIIENNHIENLRLSGVSAPSTALTGIALSGSKNSIIRNNIVHNIRKNDANYVSGIRATTLSSTSERGLNNWIYNNKVWDITNSSAQCTELSGITALYQDSLKVDYNSVYLSESGDTPPTDGSNAVWFKSTCVYPTVRNNILVNTRDDAPYVSVAIRIDAPTSLSDYNDLFVGSSSSANIAKVNTTLYKSLADWQGTLKDVHSVSGCPIFCTPALHIDTTNVSSNALNNRATPIAGILYDFQGALRNATTPDIGADEFDKVTGVTKDIAGIPETFSLSQNYPNPFNPTTTIEYQIPSQSYVTLKVFDLLGRELATLVNEKKDAGYYAVRFVATELASGVYLYRIQAGSYVQTRKLILVR